MGAYCEVCCEIVIEMSWAEARVRGCMSADTNLSHIVFYVFFSFYFLGGCFVTIKIYRYTPPAAVAVTSSHRHSRKLRLLLHSGRLVKRLSFILFVIWVSGSARVCFSKQKGIRPEITVKSMFIYKSDFVECNRNTPLNIITWILSIVNANIAQLLPVDQ